MNNQTTHLYLHVPFCRKKCAYCAFYSIPSPSGKAIDDYFRKLEDEFKSVSPFCMELESIYIGGGTPTFLPAKKLKLLFEYVFANFAVSKNAEISIECNPETLTLERTEIIAKFANRVSLGIQSFSRKFSRVLGRKNSPEAVKKAFVLLSERGLENIGCDLIYAIPGQTLQDWKNELEKAAEFPVKHISAYSLAVEEGTKLAEKFWSESASDRQVLKYKWQADDDLSAKMWKFAGKFLRRSGFRRYEISNYAKNGFECVHNLKIWHGDRYIGCGPAASSFDGKRRWTQRPDIFKWISGAKPEYDDISPEKRAREIFVMGLRTSRGWNKKYFYRCTGFDVRKFQAELDELKNLKLVKETDDDIFCTQKGFLLWNEAAEFLI